MINAVAGFNFNTKENSKNGYKAIGFTEDEFDAPSVLLLPASCFVSPLSDASEILRLNSLHVQLVRYLLL